MIRVVLAEDEAPAREKLKWMLEQIEDLELIGEAIDGLDTIEKVNELKPDVLFLDIQMPKLSGFEALNYLSPMPLVVFTTAFDEYAIKAFEASATDYLLKPFDKKRLDQTIEKIRAALGQSPSYQPLQEAWKEHVSNGDNKLKRLVSKMGDKMYILKTSDIAFIEAGRGLTRAIKQGREYLINETLDTLEHTLDPQLFVRIHRGSIINIEFIDVVEKWPGGKFLVKLKDPSKPKITTSRKGAERLKIILNL